MFHSMVFSILVCLLSLVPARLIAQNTNDTSASVLYIGTNSGFNFDFGEKSPSGSLNLGGSIMYFLNSNLVVGGNAYLGTYINNDPVQQNNYNIKWIGINPYIQFYPNICSSPCYRLFVRANLNVNTGQTKQTYLNEENITGIGEKHLAIGPGISFNLKNDKIFNIYGSLLSIDRFIYRDPNTGDRTAYTRFSGGLNSPSRFSSAVYSCFWMELLFPI